MTWRQHTAETIRSLSDAQLAKGLEKAALAADWGASYWVRSDGWRVTEMIEREQARRAGRIHEPADPGDVRFELLDPDYDPETGQPWFNEEAPYGLLMIDDQGEVIEQHAFQTSWERSSMIAAHREHQSRVAEADRLGVHPLELALEREWELEQEERQRGW